MKKIALYDVDYTIISVNSLMSFFIYSLKKKPILVLYLPFLFILFFLWVIKILPLDILKSVWLFPIKDFNTKQIENYSKDFVKKEIIPKIKKGVLENIKDFKSKGFTVILATASYEFYIKYLAEYLNADYFFGTKILFSNSKLYPKIIGKNCRGKEKINRILETIPLNKIDKKSSVGFSDSKSDLPYLDLVDNFKLISPKKWQVKKEYKV